MKQSASKERYAEDGELLFYRGDREVPGLQILKFFCALLVVQAHVYSGIKNQLIPLITIAVPVFFIITGYFLPDKFGNLQQKKITRSIRKILKLEIAVVIVYVMYNIILCLFQDGLFTETFMRWNYWLHIFFTGCRPSEHIWYLVALLQGMICIYLFVRLRLEKWLYWIIPIGLILNLILGKYNFLLADWNIPNNLVLSRNVVTMGLPCLIIGVLLRRNEHRLPAHKSMIVAAGVGVVGIYVETYILQMTFPASQGAVWLFTIPCATAVFLAFLRLDVKSKAGQRLVSYGRAYSLDIYLWHIMVANVVMLFVIKAGMDEWGAMIVIIAAIIFAAILKRTGFNRIYK